MFLLGCTSQLKSLVGNDFRFGNVNGMILINDFLEEVFEIWTLTDWNSICLSINPIKMTLKLLLNGKSVVDSTKYFLNSPIEKILLMKDFQQKPIRSHLSDAQLWNEEKSEAFIKR